MEGVRLGPHSFLRDASAEKGTAGKPGAEAAGEPARFYEPFGAVIPGLAHQELALYQKEYLQGAVTDVG